MSTSCLFLVEFLSFAFRWQQILPFNGLIIVVLVQHFLQLLEAKKREGKTLSEVWCSDIQEVWTAGILRFHFPSTISNKMNQSYNDVIVYRQKPEKIEEKTLFTLYNIVFRPFLLHHRKEPVTFIRSVTMTLLDEHYNHLPFSLPSC